MLGLWACVWRMVWACGCFNVGEGDMGRGVGEVRMGGGAREERALRVRERARRK